MPYVICSIRTAVEAAPLTISDIAFERDGEVIVSVDPVDDVEAERFASIPGYELSDVKPSDAPETPAEKPAEKRRGGRPPRNPAATEAGSNEGENAGEGSEKQPEGSEQV